jgi:bacterioferritin
MAKDKAGASAVGGEIAALLQRIHSHELSGIVRYLHYAHMIFGANRIPIVAWLKKEAEASMGHAWRIGEKMTALGLHPEMKVDPVPETGKHNVLDVLREALGHERAALADYQRLLALVVSQRPGDTALEDFVREFVGAETEHLEDSEKMLRTM